jgi:hypothetical protein
MTDEKMLELAAKAAGILFRGYDTYYEDFSAYCEYTDVNYQWNPLTNDGDALRLAVILGIYIGPSTTYDGSATSYTVNATESIFEEPHGCDKFKATCRAITRAAAAIGENMQ